MGLTRIATITLPESVEVRTLMWQCANGFNGLSEGSRPYCRTSEMTFGGTDCRAIR
jgi:hypothetical protein